MDAVADATLARSMTSEPPNPEIVPLKWNESPSLSVPPVPEPNTTLATVDASKSRVPTPSMVAVPFPLTAPSDIEPDVYFCGKFVVPLLQPVGNALARLPFLPLTPLDGPALRPASAQTFLQQSGVPTALARQIVVQHERSAERIVDSCLADE